MFVSRIFKCILVLIQHFGIVLKYANMGLDLFIDKLPNSFLKVLLELYFLSVYVSTLKNYSFQCFLFILIFKLI